MKSPIDIVEVIRNEEFFVTNVIVRENKHLVVYEVKKPSIKHSRSILILKDYVIKFDAPTPCGFQSDTEYNFWGKLCKDDKKYFSKLLFFNENEGYVIHERVRFKRGPIPLDTVEIVRQLRDKYDLIDVEAVYSFTKGKTYKTNWGVTKDGPIIYDYGT